MTPKEMPKSIIIVQDKESNYFIVDRIMQNAWSIDGDYLGELECKEVKNGWEFKLKENEN